MTETFTQDDGLRYLYHEMTPAEEGRFRQALVQNPLLNQQFMALREAQHSLSAVRMNMRESAIQNILASVEEEAHSSH